MVRYGSVWSHMVLNDPVWARLVPYCPVLSCNVPSGPVSMVPYMDPHGPVGWVWNGMFLFNPARHHICPWAQFVSLGNMVLTLFTSHILSKNFVLVLRERIEIRVGKKLYILSSRITTLSLDPDPQVRQ